MDDFIAIASEWTKDSMSMVPPTTEAFVSVSSVGMDVEIAARLDEMIRSSTPSTRNGKPQRRGRAPKGNPQLSDNLDLDAMLQVLMAPSTNGLLGAASVSSTPRGSDCLERILRTKPCIAVGCEKPRVCKGLCRNCYMVDYSRLKKLKNPRCLVLECRRTPCAIAGICRRHYDETRSRPVNKGLKKKKRNNQTRSPEESPEAISNSDTMKKAQS